MANGEHLFAARQTARLMGRANRSVMSTVLLKKAR